MTTSARRFRLALPAVLLSAALAACDQSPSTRAPADDELARKVAAMGFDPATMVVRGDRVTVDGDIILSRADILAMPDKPGPRFHYATTNRVSPGYSAIYVNSSAIASQSSAWQTAVTNARTQWSNIPGSSVVLVNDPAYASAATITIAFGQCDGGTGVIACASFPLSDGKPGPNITIDTDFKSRLTAAEKLGAVIHELGHTLGLRHTDWNNRQCSYGPCSEGESTVGAEHIDGTPTSTTGGNPSDQYSVMNAINRPWSGFTYYDRVAGRKLFPGGPGPFPSHTLSNGHPVLSWPAMLDASSYEIYFIQTDWQPFWSTVTRTYVGTTTGTTYTDNTRTFSRAVPPGECPIGPNNYVIRANFPDGTQSGDSYGGAGCYY